VLRSHKLCDATVLNRRPQQWEKAAVVNGVG
jgi:hypothetical protein